MGSEKTVKCCATAALYTAVSAPCIEETTPRFSGIELQPLSSPRGEARMDCGGPSRGRSFLTIGQLINRRSPLTTILRYRWCCELRIGETTPLCVLDGPSFCRTRYCRGALYECSGRRFDEDHFVHLNWLAERRMCRSGLRSPS